MRRRHDYVGGTTGVTQIADDLLPRPSRPSRARNGLCLGAVFTSFWMFVSFVFVALYTAQLYDKWFGSEWAGRRFPHDSDSGNALLGFARFRQQD